MVKEEKRPFPWKIIWVSIICIWLSFTLYLYHINGQSIWRDEILSIARAHQPLSLLFANRNIVQGVDSPDLHPPFYFFLLSLWQRIAGESEFAYRYFSTLISIIAIPLFLAVGKRIWGWQTGVAAVLLATVSPFRLWYAQEVRMYALLFCESLLVLYTLWPLLFPQARKRDYALFGLTTAVTVYTHYTGIFLLGFSLAAIVITRLHYRIWRQLGIIVLLLALLAIPLYPNLQELLTARGFVAFGRETPWFLLQDGLNTFSIGAATRFPDPGWRLWPFVLLAITGAFSFQITPVSRRWRVGLIGVGGAGLIVLLFYLASFIQANYANPRHLTILGPLLFLLMGHGLVTLYRAWRPLALLVGGLAIVSAALSLQQTIFDPPIIRDDVRSLAAYIEERAQPGDTVIWHDAVMSMVYDYYALDLPYTVIPQYGQADEAVALQQLDTWMQNSERVWFVTAPAPTFFNEETLPTQLAGQWVHVIQSGFPAAWSALSVDLYRPLHTVETLPSHARKVDLSNGDYAVRGVGLDPEITPGSGIWVSWYWQLQGAVSDQPPSVCIRLVDSDKTIWTDSCTSLLLPQQTHQTVAGMIENQTWLSLPTGLAPTSYEVDVFFADTVQEAGTVQVKRPFPALTLTPMAKFAGGLNLIDVAWTDDAFQTGLWVLGNLLWQVDTPQKEVLRVRAQVVTWTGKVLAEETFPLAPPDYPLQNWQTGDAVRSSLRIPLPYQLEGKYRVRLSVLQPDGSPLHRQGSWPGSTWAELDRITVLSWPFVKDVPATATNLTTAVTLADDAVQLVAYDMQRSDQTLTVTLYWRTNQVLDENYGIFVHVGSIDEPPLAQGGGVDWFRPLPAWRKGEIVATNYTIDLPPDLPDKPILVQVGMYDPDDPNLRLPLKVDGENTAENRFALGPLPNP